MDVLEKLFNCGIIPVAVIDRAEDAVPLAQAMLQGGIDVMEVTFRTDAAEQAIRQVSVQCADMLVGAGTVTTLAQCEKAVEAGAKFIVTPGFSGEIVDWCLARKLPVIPGCVTPTEIMAAAERGLELVKFFPAHIYGGLSGMKALSGPFPRMRFVPTGGISNGNLQEYITAPFVFAAGGSWVCPRAEITAGHFETITQLCAEARRILLGFQLAHVGINMENAAVSQDLCRQIGDIFYFSPRETGTANFADSYVEVMKKKSYGTLGHIAIATNSIPRALADLERRGIVINHDSTFYADGRIFTIYLQEEFGGFAMHLIQK